MAGGGGDGHSGLCLQLWHWGGGGRRIGVQVHLQERQNLPLRSTTSYFSLETALWPMCLSAFRGGWRVQVIYFVSTLYGPLQESRVVCAQQERKMVCVGLGGGGWFKDRPYAG